MIRFSFKLSINFFGKGKRVGSRPASQPESSFVDMCIEQIHAQESVRAKSTIDNYWTALRSFCQYAGKDITAHQIDNHLVEGYQLWLMNRGVSFNTISCYMRSLRALIYQILPAKKHSDLFVHVFTGKMHTEKRSISAEEINKLRELSLADDSPLKLTRDLFLFSFYALGMPFVDMAFLRKSQLSQGYIVYHRHKTGQRIRIRIEPPMQRIIDRYSQHDSPFVFPILSTAKAPHAMSDYECARSRYNRHLKQLALYCGSCHILTSYVARHSWASIAYHSNVELSVISKALGHTSPNTTLTYIREIDDDRIDTANHQLLQQIKYTSV